MYGRALIFLCIFKIGTAEDCSFPHRTLEEAWEEQLVKDLKAKDHKFAPNETTQLYVHVFLKNFNFGEDETTFIALSWVVVSWTDKRLQWNVSDYKGVFEIIYNSYKFWTPSLRMLNEVDLDDYEEYLGQCRLDKDGDVMCVPKVIHEAPCDTKLSNWPYDTQNCTLQLGFYTPFASITLGKLKKAATLMGAEYGNTWTILKMYQEYKEIDSPFRNCDKGTELRLTFLVEREGEGLGAIVVVPSLLLTIMTVCSFLISVKDNTRLGIIVFNLLCHFLLLTELSGLIPKHSRDSPTILFYLRGSVSVNIILFIFTVLLVSLRKKTEPTPSWIVTLNDVVLKSQGRFVIWPRWRAEIPTKISEDLEMVFNQWAEFSDILNSICFWLVIIVYVCFICFYIPRPSRLYFEEALSISDWP